MCCGKMIGARMKRQEDRELVTKNDKKSSSKLSFFKNRVRKTK